ncbi:PAS domain-containing sensor histidine kinase [Aggregicoccus sp. 17bor-14]|uniref:PAS domain-containing sensor histidine kinase n=1 Tax=Myxococcaceae TaxID=31 RepID=UPI00129C2267|nr:MULTISPECIES: PAS domain-containing sensor histidine kinase [Myxococcaceae]MBF5043901.1 PAS domain-containing protein [Simulacricoccus sp. 17bor-14]MRI89652.1 PAS domain-containing sensor histidine kinase [Aggregicoccus sp. 17bor-14]
MPPLLLQPLPLSAEPPASVPGRAWVVGASAEAAAAMAHALPPDLRAEPLVGAPALLARLPAGPSGAPRGQDPGARPDAVLLDGALEDCADLCRRVRERHDALALPLLVLGGAADLEALVEAGANDRLDAGALELRAPGARAALCARVSTLVRLGQLAHLQRHSLAALFEQAPAFIAHVSGPTHVFDMANAAYVRLFGGRALLGKPLREVLPELEGQPYFELLDRVYATGEPFTAREMPARLDREGNGTVSEVLVTFVFQPTRAPGGQVDGILIHAVEVTELVRARKEAEAAQQAQAGLLQALAAQSLVFVALVRGPELVFEMTNSGYRKLFGGRDLVGKPLLEAAPELRGQGFDALIAEVIATGRPFTGREMPVVLEQEDGALEERRVSFVYQPVQGASGTFDGVLITGTDVTEAVHARQEAQARLAFEERLIGIVGHDLRSPLAAVRMSASQLQAPGALAPGLSGAQERAVARVERGARRIQAVITSLLDLTRARSGRGFPVAPAPADLDATLRQALEEVRVTYPGRELRYAHQGDTRGLFDEGRLAQVAVNLLENALKYGAPDRPVQLTCEGDAQALRFCVHNEGAPIPPELVAQLFQPFVRGPQSQDTVRVSVGLGLYIVREILQAHGGSIRVHSDEGSGTTFRVELPRAALEAAAGADEPPERARAGRSPT